MSVSRRSGGARAYDAVVRRPSGYRRAVKGNARKRSLPATAFDDFPWQREAYAPLRAMKRMLQKGVPQEDAIRRVKIKWNLSAAVASSIYDLAESLVF